MWKGSNLDPSDELDELEGLEGGGEGNRIIHASALNSG